MNVKLSSEPPAPVESCAAYGDEPPPIADITTVLQALGDPVRMAIVRSLAGGDPRPCGSFRVAVTKSTLSHHFRVLREAGVIGHRSEGTRRMISLRRAELDAAYPGLLDSVLHAARPEPAALRPG